MKLKRSTFFPFACALVLIALSMNIGAQTAEPVLDKNDPNQVLAYQGDVVITQQEIDAAFSQIPEVHRLAFIRDGAKVDQLVRNLLEIKMLKNDAIAHGLDEDPLVTAAVNMAADQEMAKIWTQRIPSLAPEADFEAMAKEDYLANPKSYDKSASIDITQILISTEERTLPEAEEIALDLKAKLDLEPEMFQKFVALYSDDDTKLTTFGQLKKVTMGKMVPPFEQAAFALETIGQISDPVTTDYGVHLIRLDGQHSGGIPPFEVVREEAIEKQKLTYQKSYLRKYLSQLFSEPAVFPEGSVEVMAKRHFGENLELAPTYSEDNE
ncbi:MAG TPA: peptidylprolyl isomerase [Xanthomonadales bacterium]|nr:peptidylprolyl isomerase [Xanthomonadales bacterium]